jgi:hypothetical protein
MPYFNYVTAANRISKDVVCLISVLAFHELTTQVPDAVDVSNARVPACLFSLGNQ